MLGLLKDMFKMLKVTETSFFKNQKNQSPNVAKHFPKKFIKFWQSFDKLLLVYNF
jgi:hypothetical protein